MALSRVVGRFGRTVIVVVLAVLVVLPVLSSVAAAAPVIPAPIPGTAPASPVVPPTPPAGAPVVNLPIPGSITPAAPSQSVPTGTAVPPAAAPGGNVPQSLGLAPPPGSAVAVPPSVKGFVAGASVEDASGRAAKTKRFKNPDGSTTLAVSQRPVFFQDSKGAWQPVDTSIVADPAMPGGLVSKANTWTAHFAPLPIGVRIDSPEGQLAFSPAGAAPVAPTQTAADTVTYVNAWPGVDLRYQVLGDEVKETIILNRRPTSATFAFTTAGLGFTAAAGGALAPQRAKSQWTLSPPVIEDKLGTPLPNAPVTLTGTGKAAGAAVAVAVSPSWLAAQPDSAFPILVDPSAVYGSNNMTAYKSDGTTCSACGLQVGNPAQANGTYYWRSVGYFDYTPLFGQHISNATVTVSSLNGGTANGYPFGVWWAGAYSYAGATGTQEVAGTADTAGNLTSANLTAAYDYWVHNRIAGAALGFTGYETPGVYSYKQFYNFTLSLTSYTTAPSPAQNQTAWATPDGVIHTSWTPSADDGGAAVSYKVNLYHQGGGAPAGTLVCSGTGVYWTGLGDDTSWYFGITAQNSAGSSAEVYTNTVTVTHPPGTPTALLGYPGNGAVYVTWSAPADPGGTPIDNYLLAAVDETDPAHPQFTAFACCSGYPIGGLVNGHAYAIVVYAHDHDGYSVPAVTPTAGYVTPSANPPPYPVQQLYAASAANGGAWLSWRPPLATNGGAAVTSYAVSVWDTTTGTVYVGQILNIAANAASFYYPGLTNGRSYLFAISAGNAAGYASVFTAAVTPSATPPPGPVTNATAQPGDTYAVLQWTPASSGPAPVGYVIYRYNDNNPISPVYLDYQVTASTPPSYTWGSLTNGTKYLFYVWAYNNNGFAVPTATNPVTPASGLGNLLNPTNVQAIPADTTAVVSWTPPTINLLITYTVKAYNATSGALAATSIATNGAGPCTAGNSQYPPIVTSPPNKPCLAFPRLTLTNGTSYDFVVTASLLNLVQTGISSPSPAVTPAGRPFPPTITNVANATLSGGAATVTWTPPAPQIVGSTTTPGDNGSPITSYTVTATAVAGSNAPTETAVDTNPSILQATVGGLYDGTAYNFTVTATNAIGVSDLSNIIQFTPVGVPFPPVITAAIAGPGNGMATVTWNPPPTQSNGVSGDNGASIISYTVTASGGPQNTVSGSPPPMTAQIGGLTPGQSYTFTVKATNTIGSSPASQASNAVVPFGAPTGPTNVTAAAGDTTATVSWSASSANGASVSSYTAFAYDYITNAQITTQTTPDGGTLQTTFTNLTNGKAYYFRVQANSSNGSSPLSSPSGPVTPGSAGQGPLNAPTNVTAVGYDGQATVSWTAPTSTGTPIRSYTVFASPGGAEASTADGSTTTASVTGLVDGTAYTFTAVANSVLGPSPDSAPSAPVTPLASGVPNPPSILDLQGGQGSATVWWNPPSGGAGISSYVVTASDGRTTQTADSQTLNATLTGFSTPEDNVTFTVRAVNNAGAGAPSNPAGPLNVGLPGQPPATVIPGNGSITITWTDSPEYGIPVDHYEIDSEILAPCNPCFTLLKNVPKGNPSTYTYTTTAPNGGGPALRLVPVSGSGDYGQADDFSGGRSIQAGTPTQPTITSATPVNNGFNVNWSPSGNANGFAIQGYIIEAWFNNPDPYKDAAVASVRIPNPAATSGTIISAPNYPTSLGLVNGTNYLLTVAAYNANGEGAKSALFGPGIPAAQPPPPPPPPAPQGGVGVYESTPGEPAQAGYLTSSFAGIGSVDGYCTAPSAAYACDSHLLTNVSTAFQTTGSTKFWLSYWTIGAPIGADTWNADGITAGANAARFIDSGASAHKPDFVVLDPEGFGTQLQPSDPANWSAWVAGWATGVRSVDGTLKPALYASQGQIHQFQLYSVSQANNMALFPADGDLGNFALTPSVPLSQSAGYAAYYGQCPSARYVQEILSWGAQYNTIQFKGTPCAP